MPSPVPAPSTVALERCLLRRLAARREDIPFIPRCRVEWFTSAPRKIIFGLLQNHKGTDGRPLSDAAFPLLADALYPGSDPQSATDRALLESEWRQVQAAPMEESAESAIRQFEERDLARRTREMLAAAAWAAEKGDIEGALEKIKQGTLELARPTAESRVVALWHDTADWIEQVTLRKEKPGLFAGIKTGYEKFDKMTGGLFPAELTVVFGLSGKGKSTLMKQIGVNVRRNGFNVLHCGNEEDEFQMRTKYTAVETGIPYAHWKRGIFTDSEMAAYKAYRDAQCDPAHRHGEIYVYSFPQQTDATMIERQLALFREQGIKIDLLIVDYLDLMSSIKRAYNENDEGGRVTGDLKQLAIDYHIPVLVCTQAATTAEKQETKERPFLTAADVFGTKRKVHSANTLIGIVNQTATVGAGDRDEPVTRHHLVISVPKNRDGSVFTFRLAMEVETGRVVPDDDTYVPGMEEKVKAAEQMTRDVAMAEDGFAATITSQQEALVAARKANVDEINRFLPATAEVAVQTPPPSAPLSLAERWATAKRLVAELVAASDSVGNAMLRANLELHGLRDFTDADLDMLVMECHAGTAADGASPEVAADPAPAEDSSDAADSSNEENPYGYDPEDDDEEEEDYGTPAPRHSTAADGEMAWEDLEPDDEALSAPEAPAEPPQARYTGEDARQRENAPLPAEAAPVPAAAPAPVPSEATGGALTETAKETPPETTAASLETATGTPAETTAKTPPSAGDGWDPPPRFGNDDAAVVLPPPEVAAETREMMRGILARMRKPGAKPRSARDIIGGRQ